MTEQTKGELKTIIKLQLRLLKNEHERINDLEKVIVRLKEEIQIFKSFDKLSKKVE